MSRGKKKHTTPAAEISSSAPEAENQLLAPTEQLTDEQAAPVAGTIAPVLEPALREIASNALPEEWKTVVCPIPSDPALGDKTPEVMAWYLENAPEEYARRYQNRVTPHSDGARQVVRPDLTGPDPALENEEEPERKPKVIIE